MNERTHHVRTDASVADRDRRGPVAAVGALAVPKRLLALLLILLPLTLASCKDKPVAEWKLFGRSEYVGHPGVSWWIQGYDQYGRETRNAVKLPGDTPLTDVLRTVEELNRAARKGGAE